LKLGINIWTSRIGLARKIMHFKSLLSIIEPFLFTSELY